MWLVCRVATGINAEERDQISAKLKDLLIPAQGSSVPKMYHVTAGRRERPHYWVKDPHKSVVLKVGYLTPSTSVA